MNNVTAVLDVDLMLQDSKFIEQNNSNCASTPLTFMHCIHIQIPLNFSQILDQPKPFSTNNQNNTKEWLEPFKTRVLWVTKISKECLHGKMEHFKNLLDALPHHKLKTKNQFDIATGRIMLATHNTVQTSKLEARIVAQYEKLKNLQ
jgi:hypothetical protein